MTYITNLAKVKVDLYTKDEDRRSNVSTMSMQTDGQTDATKCIICLASRSIKRERERKEKKRKKKLYANIFLITDCIYCHLLLFCLG